jgi:hypothetical protein
MLQLQRGWELQNRSFSFVRFRQNKKPEGRRRFASIASGLFAYFASAPGAL